ncbi:MAG: carbohydrate ABC transporter permease [Oscillospiraceae bacterium]|nr:carbohydrate ABC transporter permease [Oscillospiraceae bacterium]
MAKSAEAIAAAELKKKNKIGLSAEDKTMYTIVNIIIILLLILIIYPVIFVVSSSFSSGDAVSSGRDLLWPVEPSVVGYDIVFHYRTVWSGFANTLLYTVAGTAWNLFMTTLAAYPLSRRNFQGRGIYMTLFTITMFFTGGIIPHYLLMVNLGLTNTRWALIIPGAINVHNMIIMRTFFRNSIPGELQEAAMLDGCSDIRYLLQIVLPLSKAVMSVLLLYYAVGHWNSYYSALLYIRDETKFPLQLILRTILIASTSTDLTQIESSSAQEAAKSAGEAMRYALIVVSTAPILVVYPWIQKYFEKGVMIGSVKG